MKCLRPKNMAMIQDKVKKNCSESALWGDNKQQKHNHSQPQAITHSMSGLAQVCLLE